MKTSWQIKTKTDYSAAELAELVWQLADAAYPAGSPWTLAQFQADIENVHSRYFILFAEEAVGFLSVQVLFEEAEVTNFAIQNDRQQMGYGKILMKTSKKQLITAGVRQIFLEVRVSNHPARQLYLALGFVTIARRNNYYQHPTEDALIMSWKEEKGNYET